MKDTALLLAKFFGVFSFCRWVTRKQLRILAYHGIWMGDDHFGNFLYMSPAKFTGRMQRIKKLGFPVLSIDDALKRREEGTLPHSATVLTIDDGWYSTYVHMIPVLERLHFPATVYVASYYCEKQVPVVDVALAHIFSSTVEPSIEIEEWGVKLDLCSLSNKKSAKRILLSYLSNIEEESERQRMMHKIGELLGVDYFKIVDQKLFHLVSRAQVKNMCERGIDIQLHTHRHRVSLHGVNCIPKEIQDNRDSLEPLVGRPLVHFCYPNGINDKAMWPHLEASKIASATVSDSGFVRVADHRYALRRILDGEQVSDIEFEAEMCGFYEIKRNILKVLK